MTTPAWDTTDAYDGRRGMSGRPRPYGHVRPRPQRELRRHVVSSLDPPIYRRRPILHEVAAPTETARPDMAFPDAAFPEVAFPEVPPGYGTADTQPVPIHPGPSGPWPPASTEIDEPRRWAGPLTALGLSGAVAVAWLVLVWLRLSTAARAATEASGVTAARLQEAVTETLMADRTLSVLQWITTVSTTVVLGAVIYRLFVARPVVQAGRGAALRLMRAAAVVGMLTTLASVFPRAVAVSGSGVAASWDVEVLWFVVRSRFGDAGLLRLIGLFLLLRVSLSDDASGRRRLERGACLVGGVLILAAFVLVGHPRATNPAPVLVLAQGVHVVAVSTWFGGVTVLVLELRRLKRDGGAHQLGEVVGRFSHVAMATVAAAAVSGLVLARSQISSLDALVSTAYGRALVAKLCILAVPLALGGYNARYLVPALAREVGDNVWKRLRTTMAAEASLIALGVLLFTTAMVTGGL